MVDTASGFPAPPITTPFVDAHGNITRIWYRWLLTLFDRTGGSGGFTPGGLILQSGMLGTPQDPAQNADLSLFSATPSDALDFLPALWTSTPPDPLGDALLAALMTGGDSGGATSPATGVTAGSYTSTNLTVNSSGLITFAESGGMLPLVTGDTSPGTGPYPIATPDGEYIGVPL